MVVYSWGEKHPVETYEWERKVLRGFIPFLMEIETDELYNDNDITHWAECPEEPKP